MGSGGGSGSLPLAGLSPEQRQWLQRAAQEMRNEALGQKTFVLEIGDMEEMRLRV